jgi:signal peptidase II
MKLAEAQKQFAAWRGAARANPLFIRSVAGAALVAAIDQASKAYVVHGLKLPEIGRIEISSLFDLTFVRNYGASFGLLAGHDFARVILSVVSIGVATLLIAWLASLKRPLAAAAVAFIVGGALGNLVDRVSLGYVVDFFDFSGFPFPHVVRTSGFPGFSLVNGGFVWVFNVADAAINIGIGLLALDWWREGRRESVNSRVSS